MRKVLMDAHMLTHSETRLRTWISIAGSNFSQEGMITPTTCNSRALEGLREQEGVGLRRQTRPSAPSLDSDWHEHCIESTRVRHFYVTQRDTRYISNIYRTSIFADGLFVLLPTFES